MLRRKKVLANINKEKISLADQPLPNAKRFLFGEDFPTVASKQAELSRGLAKNLSNSQKPKQTFQKSAKPRTGNALRPQVTSLSTRETNQKTIGPFAPTRAPQTKTQQLLREVEGNHFRSRNLTCCVGISNPFPVCSCSLTRSSYKMFRFNSSPRSLLRSRFLGCHATLPPKKRLLTSEQHSFPLFGQSQLSFHFREPCRAKFAL